MSGAAPPWYGARARGPITACAGPGAGRWFRAVDGLPVHRRSRCHRGLAGSGRNEIATGSRTPQPPTSGSSRASIHPAMHHPSPPRTTRPAPRRHEPPGSRPGGPGNAASEGPSRTQSTHLDRRPRPVSGAVLLAGGRAARGRRGYPLRKRDRRPDAPPGRTRWAPHHPAVPGRWPTVLGLRRPGVAGRPLLATPRAQPSSGPNGEPAMRSAMRLRDREPMVAQS